MNVAMRPYVKRAAALTAAALLLAISPLSAGAREFTTQREERYWLQEIRGKEFFRNIGSINMQVGETRDLRSDLVYEAYEDEEPEIFAVGPQTWATDRPTVATVSSKGVVTARREGSAKISVTYMDNRDNTITHTMRVRVGLGNTASSYTSAEYYFTLTEGRRISLGELVFPDVPAESVAWSTDHDNLLSVDSAGTVTTLRHGIGNVLASYSSAGGETVSRKITLEIQTVEATQVFQKIAITLRAGQRVDIKKMLYPDGTLPGRYDTLTCRTSDSGVAGMDGHLLTAETAGSCTISVELSKKNDAAGEMETQRVDVRVVPDSPFK